MLWPVVLIPIGAYAGLVALLFFFQSRFVYFPVRTITVTPAAVGLAYEDIHFRSEDGVELHGWFIPAENAKGVVLFCHGNAGNISHRLESILVFRRLEISTFIFDYRGYGRSEGTPTEQGTYLDAEAAYQYLVRERGNEPSEILVFGRSLGGAIAAHLAEDYTPRALIIESTFTSVPDLAAQLYPYLPVRLLSRFQYDALGHVRQVDCPLLIVHSRDDEMIPFDHGRRLFEAASEPKHLLEILGSHNEAFIVSGERYVGGLEAFMSALWGL
jgi:fermentation-respiration switch protein FrsA (DUF1100 family)